MVLNIVEINKNNFSLPGKRQPIQNFLNVLVPEIPVMAAGTFFISYIHSVSAKQIFKLTVCFQKIIFHAARNIYFMKFYAGINLFLFCYLIYNNPWIFICLCRLLDVPEASVFIDNASLRFVKRIFENMYCT